MILDSILVEDFCKIDSEIPELQLHKMNDSQISEHCNCILNPIPDQKGQVPVHKDE